jgi:electron transfer flavoprotein alpha subunit
MAKILTFSDKKDTALELVSKGRELSAALGLELVAAALGPGAAETAAELGRYGARQVYVSEDEVLEGLPVDVAAEALAQIARQAEATYVLLGSTRRGKELAGRLAMKLDAGAVTDVNAVDLEDGDLIASRYYYGGTTVTREKVSTPVKVFAVMPKTFELGSPADGDAEVVQAQLDLPAPRVKIVERRPKEGTGVDLGSALRIVGIGRGLGKREDLELGHELARALEAELGCTKGLVDFEWMPEECVIGLSGAKAKPDLYIAVGISGQIQHTVGISSAKVIAAVNSDKEAPIFGLADYGIVGDLYQVVPALVERLKSAVSA